MWLELLRLQAGPSELDVRNALEDVEPFTGHLLDELLSIALIHEHPELSCLTDQCIVALLHNSTGMGFLAFVRSPRMG